MIPRVMLLRQLKKLDKLYQVAISTPSTDSDLPKYYSRLAVLEIGSWIEECMDELVRTLPRRKRTKVQSNMDYIALVVKKNYGFDYDQNFRRMMKSVIGVVLLEQVERKMDSVKKLGLESALTLLYPERNDHAHKPIHTAPSFTAPSVCISRLDDIYTGLEEFEKHLKRI